MKPIQQIVITTGKGTGREARLSRIRTCLDSEEFKSVSLGKGYEYSYCTFTPLSPSETGFIAFHWYKDLKWEAAVAIVPMDMAALISDNTDSMHAFVLGMLKLE